MFNKNIAMNKKNQTVVITVISLLIVLFAFMLSTRLWFRLDLTKNRSWTISKVSKNLKNEIPEQVRITYFVTDKLKKLYSFPAEIEDLIGEYVSFSAGKITFVEHDPAKENLIAKMQELGFPAQEIRVLEKDEASFSNVYTGILIEYENRHDTLPFVFKLDTLEYDITKRILSLVREKEKNLGVIIGDTGKTLEREYGYLNETLQGAGYKVRGISLEEIIPDDLTELFVLGGAASLDDWNLYQIDRYIQNGGKVYFALNSTVINTSDYGVSAKPLEDKGLLAMVKSYGAQIKSALVLDKSSLAMPVPQNLGIIQITNLVPYPFYVHILTENCNGSHPVSSGFNSADLYWPNPVILEEIDSVSAEPLFTTTDEAWLQTRNFDINPQTGSPFAAERKSTTGKKVLAAALSGKFPSYYRDKPKPSRKGSETELPALPEEAAETRIIVIGNAGTPYDFSMGNIDFRRNSFAQEQTNLNFIVQAADWLGNDDDVISIRSRVAVTGRLDRITDKEKRAGSIFIARTTSMIIAPVIVLAAGILLAQRRRRRGRGEEQNIANDTNE